MAKAQDPAAPQEHAPSIGKPSQNSAASDHPGLGIAFELHPPSALIERLSKTHDPVVFVVGSALSMPVGDGSPGVPGVSGVVEMIRQNLSDATECTDYGSAFRTLIANRGQDYANAIIRRAVLQARWPSPPSEPQGQAELGSEVDCERLERDIEGWWLSPALEALGRIVANNPKRFPTIITSNFDPLIKISIQRAGGRAFSTIADIDGYVDNTIAEGCRIVHFHGYWFRSDTLHAPLQLQYDRRRLESSLRSLINGRTVVVVGYGGWDDALMRALEPAAPADVLWAFFHNDYATIAARNAKVLSALSARTGIGRAIYYGGVDANVVLPAIAETIAAPEQVSPARADDTISERARRLPVFAQNVGALFGVPLAVPVSLLVTPGYFGVIELSFGSYLSGAVLLACCLGGIWMAVVRRRRTAAAAAAWIQAQASRWGLDLTSYYRLLTTVGEDVTVFVDLSLHSPNVLSAADLEKWLIGATRYSSIEPRGMNQFRIVIGKVSSHQETHKWIRRLLNEIAPQMEQTSRVTRVSVQSSARKRSGGSA